MTDKSFSQSKNDLIILCSNSVNTHMEKLVIEKTVKTPFISADLNGEIRIEGISVPENSMEFYEPLKIWLDKYVSSPSKKTVCEIKLEYFNTSTASILLNFLKYLNKIHLAGDSVVINWYHDASDFEIQESGKDLKSLIDAPFNIIQLDK